MEYSPGTLSINKSITEIRNLHIVCTRACIYQVAQTLRNAHCGRINNQPKVYCNDEEEEVEDLPLQDARFVFFISAYVIQHTLS